MLQNRKREFAVLNNGRELPTVPSMRGSVALVTIPTSENLSVLSQTRVTMWNIHQKTSILVVLTLATCQKSVIVVGQRWKRYFIVSKIQNTYNDGQNGCCLAYISNTSNLDSNHFVHHALYVVAIVNITQLPFSSLNQVNQFNFTVNVVKQYPNLK